MTPATTIDGPAIEVRGLRKSYGDHVVLDGIDLTVPRGKVLALLGPNGAGKTTVVNILSTLIPPDAGAVSVVGHDVTTDPDRVRRSIGVTGQFAAIDDLLTGEENVTMIGRLLHLDPGELRTRTRDLLGRFDLLDVAGQLPSTYSGGMRRRLDLAMGLVGRPEVLFLDEPTTGLDPRSRRTLWDIVGDLVAEGVTILLTTQYLEEADHLADRVALLDRGAIAAEGTPGELKRRVPGGRITLTFSGPDALARAERTLRPLAVDREAISLDIASDGGVGALRSVLGRLDDEQIPVEELVTHSPGLDDVFLALTGTGVATTDSTET